MYRSPKKILLGQDNNALVFLFAINALVFVLINFVKIVYYLTDIPLELFYKQILNWFTLPAIPKLFFSRPWTILSFMFTHYSFWHLLSSMMWLWAFGFILQDLAGNNKLIPVYLYGGLIGGTIFLLSNNLFPGLEKNILTITPMLGSGTAVMAVAIATTTLAPGYRIFPQINGGIPLWVLTILFVALNFTSFSGGNLGAAAAHIGAAAIGFVYVKQLQSGKDWGNWMVQLFYWVDDLFSPEKKHTNKSSDKHFYRASRKPYEKIANQSQQKLNDILDKINQQGFNALTDDEKNYLNRAGNDEDL
jgi:membrane associated rhomboid family serine protease